MAATDYKFHGWQGLDKNCIHGNMKWDEFKPKTWEEVRKSLLESEKWTKKVDFFT